MSERLITKKAVKQVITDYWEQVAKNPFKSLVAFVTPGLGSIFVFYIPTLVISGLINDFASNNAISLQDSLIYVASFAAAWLTGEVLWRIGLHFLIKVESGGLEDLSKKSFLSLMDKDYGFYANNFVGTLVKKASSYSRNFVGVVDVFAFNVVSEIIPLTFAVIILWRYSPWIPITLLVCIMAIVFIAVPIIKKRVKLIAERHDASSKMVGRLSDSLTNALAIKSFSNEKRESRIFGRHVDTFINKFNKAANYQNQRYDVVIAPLYVLTNVIGLLMAIYFAQELSLQPGVIVVVFTYFASITRAFWSISKIYRSTEAAISEAAEFTQLFINPPAIQDSPNAKKLKPKDGGIVFSNIAFNYCDATEDKDCFLNDFSLSIEPGQRVGLVGPSGGGKTTITKLILRFVDTQSGEIVIDGQDIKKVTQESLRSAISYVPQESLLFHRSLHENIAYGDNKATKKEVIAAAKKAHAHEFISKLPEGYDTLVGERGIKLSGGQRQRVAIARALLKKAPILVLDEATSSLDSESEKYIQEGLWELMKDKTAIVIAHRLSTIKHMDRILVLDNGKIVQDGTHEDLVKEKGVYKRLWSHQSGDSDRKDMI